MLYACAGSGEEELDQIYHFGFIKRHFYCSWRFNLFSISSLSGFIGLVIKYFLGIEHLKLLQHIIKIAIGSDNSKEEDEISSLPCAVMKPLEWWRQLMFF